MGIEAYKNILKLLDKQVKKDSSKNDDNINEIYMFSKSFLSFSKSEEQAKQFYNNNPPNNTINCEFIIEINDDEHFNNIEIGKNNSDNPQEEEILFLPYSCFIIENNKKKEKEENEENRFLFKLYLRYFNNYDKKVNEKIQEIKVSNEAKEKIENAFLNEYGKYLYNMFNFITDEYDKYIEEETQVKIKSKIPLNKDYFKSENQVKDFYFPRNKQENDEEELEDLDEVIYKVEESDIDKEGLVRIIGENKKGDDFLKLNKDKVYLIINGKKENLCYKYKLPKGENKIKFVFSEGVTNLSFLFCECTSLFNISALNKWDVSKVSDFSYLFDNCTSLTNIAPLRNWNVSNGINFSNLFYKCTSLKSVMELKKWNVGNGIHFSYLFYNCSSLISISGLREWNVEKGIFFTCLFSKCTELFDISPLSNWNVSHAVYLDYLFSGCSSLKNVTCLKKWNVSNANYFDYLFYDCINLKNISGLINWNVKKCINFSYAFYNCISLTDITALKKWDVSAGQNFLYMFKNCNIIEESKPSWFYKTN